MVELALAGRAGRLRLLFFGREELPVGRERADAAAGARAGCRRRARRRDGADGQRAAGRLPGQRQRHAGPSTGARGHSARPWLADNAIHRAARGHRRARRARRRAEHDFDGLEFLEVASVTQIAGGIAANVIPDRVECARQLPLRARALAGGGRGAAARAVRAATASWRSSATRRPAPCRSATRSSSALRGRRPRRSRPSRRGRRWPSSAAAGVDAVNFGPGDPAQAHSRDEPVEIAALVRAYEVLERFGVA